MKTALYPRLAWDGLRKNKRLFTPYLLTCVCMVMMFYILSFLGSPETCALLPRGSNSTGLILNLGSFVIFVFSAIFLYYTNSFLVRRREREFGLYNVLGMNKRNLARIVTWESLITAVLSLVLGLALGIVLSKLAELGLVNMLGGDINYRIRIDVDSLTRALGLYAIIFAVIWLSTVVRVGRSSAVALLRSESVGEKPPKANWLLGLAGVVILAAAYYLAVSITNPLDAIVWFFVAVILVIIGTYLLLVAGSVLLCRVLQKNKKYYYRPEHFVSVSSMAYRMKRNGAGLASVCIIATMILVMISSSSCLYFGAEDSANMRYPRDVNITLAGETPEQITEAISSATAVPSPIIRQSGAFRRRTCRTTAISIPAVFSPATRCSAGFRGRAPRPHIHIRSFVTSISFPLRIMPPEPARMFRLRRTRCCC